MNDELQAAIQGHFLAIIFGCILALPALWIAIRGGYFKEPYSRIHSGSLDLIDVLIAFATYLGMNFIIVPLVSWLLLSFHTGQWKYPEKMDIGDEVTGWVTVAGFLSTAIIMMVMCRLLGQRQWHVVWGENAFEGLVRNIKDFFFGMTSWLVIYPIVLLVGQISGLMTLLYTHVPHIDQVAVKYLKMTLAYPYLFGAMAILMVFIVPITEEFLFRGFLQTWLKGIFGKIGALIATSLIFALFHYSPSQGVHNADFVVSLFTLSIFLGWNYERQNSLWASIGLHATFNGVSVLFVIASPKS